MQSVSNLDGTDGGPTDAVNPGARRSQQRCPREPLLARIIHAFDTTSLVLPHERDDRNFHQVGDHLDATRPRHALGRFT